MFYFINIYMNIVFKFYSFFIKHINSFINLLYSIVFKNISGNNMYLSAIVIFGKEISPWWIAGGVGTGLVVAGVIIYMRNHKDDDPNFKAPKIKDIKKVYKKPVKEEVIAEPEVPIIKESTIVPVISEQIAPQGVIAEQII